MSMQLPREDVAVWDHLVESYNGFTRALDAFLAEGVDRVSVLQSALHSKDKNAAIYMLRYLKTSELQQLFNDLVFLASCSHGGITAIREAVLSLPREWVLANIERAAEPLLQQGSHEEYRRLLELYSELDHDLTMRLARRAVEQPDEDIIEAGRDFLDKADLKSSCPSQAL